MRLRDRDLQGIPKSIRRSVLLPYCVAEAVVHRQEAQALAQEAIRQEIDVEMDAANFLAQLLHPFAPLQERGANPDPFAVRRLSEILLMDKTLKRGSVTMTEFSIMIAFSKEASMGAVEESRLRPDEKSYRR